MFDIFLDLLWSNGASWPIRLLFTCMLGNQLIQRSLRIARLEHTPHWLHYPLSLQNMITVYDYTESILLSLTSRRHPRFVNTNRFVQSLQQTAVSVVLSSYWSCQAHIDVQQIDRLSHTLCKIVSLERDCLALQPCSCQTRYLHPTRG